MIQLRSLFFACFFLIITSISAQEYNFGVQLGGSIYFGDLDAPKFSENLKNTSFAGGAFFRYHFNDVVNARLNIFAGKLKGDDSTSNKDWQQLRNLSFKSSVIEAAGLIEIDLVNLFSEYGSEKWRIYLSTGIAIFHFNPKTLYEGTWYELQPLGTEGQGLAQYPNLQAYNLTQVSIPFGGGVEYRISDNYSVGMEIISRRSFTDYIDDVSGNYINYLELMAGNGELAATLANRQGEFLGQSEPVMLATGTKRGQPDVKDYYLTMMVNFIYHFDGFGNGGGKNNKIGCPRFD